MFGPVGILGEFKEGETLAARTNGVVSFSDLIKGSEEYQWMLDGKPISGETGKTYRVKSSDKDKYISFRYSFETRKGKCVIESDPEWVFDPVVDALHAIYFLVFNRRGDDGGISFYASHFRNGVPLSNLVKDMEKNKAKGAK